MGIVGLPEYRIEGWAKVTGTACYTADVRRDGLLDVTYLRSPYPHARIVSIDTAAAERMPGVRRVLTGAGVRPLRLGVRSRTGHSSHGTAFGSSAIASPPLRRTHSRRPRLPSR
jgi:CO/xanthine dehydrogenase Mo-binding subunit